VRYAHIVWLKSLLKGGNDPKAFVNSA